MWESLKRKAWRLYFTYRPIDVTTVDIGEYRPLDIMDVLAIESLSSPVSVSDHWIKLASLVHQRTRLSHRRIALMSVPEFSILSSRVGRDVRSKVNAHNSAEDAGWSAPLSNIGGTIQ